MTNVLSENGVSIKPIVMQKSAYLALTHELKKRSKQFRHGYAQGKEYGIKSAPLQNPCKSSYEEKLGAMLASFEKGEVDNFKFDRKTLAVFGFLNKEIIYKYEPERARNAN